MVTTLTLFALLSRLLQPSATCDGQAVLQTGEVEAKDEVKSEVKKGSKFIFNITYKVPKQSKTSTQKKKQRTSGLKRIRSNTDTIFSEQILLAFSLYTTSCHISISSYQDGFRYAILN